MKRIILIFQFLLCLQPLLAQEDSDYRPFIEEGKVWTSYRFMPGWLIGHYIEYDYFEGDTIVSGKQCKLWIQEYVPRDGNGQSYKFSVPAYEEKRKVWFFHEGDENPRLAYDFGASPGDKLVVYPADALEFQYALNNYGLDFYNKTLIDTLLVLARGEIVAGGLKQEAIYFTSYKTNYQSAINEWDCHLVGIGSMILPTFTCSIGYNTTKKDLIYCLKEKEILYLDKDLAEERKVPLPTNINQTLYGKSVNGQCFDLTGRRLAAPPAKGVYIKDGKIQVTH